MHYFLWLELGGFYLRRTDENASIAIVRDGQVLEASRSALGNGVRTGMAVRQAKTLCAGLTTLPWNPDEHREAAEEWLDVCAQYTQIVAPGEPHQAMLDLSAHPHPRTIARRVIAAVRLRTGLIVRWGASPTPWISRLAARIDAGDMPMTDPQGFLDPLPTDLFEPVEHAVRERLVFLGFRTIGQVAALSLDTLRGQFDEQGLAIYNAAHGLHSEPVLAAYPPEALHDDFVFDGAMESREMFLGALQQLSERMGEALQARDLQGQSLWVSVDTSEGRTLAYRRAFAKPIRCPLSLLSALKLLILESVEEPIEAVRITLPRLERVRRVQQSLMGIAGAERSPAVDSALRTLSTNFGEGKIMIAAQRSEPRRKRVLQAWRHAIGW